MNCKQYRNEIEEADSAAGATNAGGESHAAACPPCRAFADERAALRRLVAGLGRVDAPPDFEFRLRARMSAAEAAEARPAWALLRPRAAWAAVAVCLVLAALVTLKTRDAQTPPATDVRPASKPGAVAQVEHGAVEVKDQKSVEPAPAAQTVERTTGVASAGVARATPRRRAPAAAPREAREAVASRGARQPQTETSTSSMTGSPVHVSTAIPLPVQADGRPLQVLFQDMQGESRVIKVDPVAFGSNDPAAAPAARTTNVTFTKASKKQGVW